MLNTIPSYGQLTSQNADNYNHRQKNLSFKGHFKVEAVGEEDLSSLAETLEKIPKLRISYKYFLGKTFIPEKIKDKILKGMKISSPPESDVNVLATLKQGTLPEKNRINCIIDYSNQADSNM